MNELAIRPNIPEWVNLCDGDWMELKKLDAHELPTMNEINATIENLTAQSNCSISDATAYAEELSLPVANNDTRMQSPRFGRIIVKLFMEYPPEIVDQAIDNLMFNLKWYPEPEVIKQELDKCHAPVRIALGRAKNFRMLVKHNPPKPKGVSATPEEIQIVKDKLK